MENLIFYCLLLVAAFFNLKGAPTDQPSDGPHDVRWRIVSGFETTYRYSDQMVSKHSTLYDTLQCRSCTYRRKRMLMYVNLQMCGIEPLLNVSGDLEPILTGVCWLLEIQELITEVQNGSDLQAILEQNALDSCRWVCISYVCT